MRKWLRDLFSLNWKFPKEKGLPREKKTWGPQPLLVQSRAVNFPSWEVLKSRLFSFSVSSADIWEEGEGKSHRWRGKLGQSSWKLWETWETSPGLESREWHVGHLQLHGKAHGERIQRERMKRMETGKPQADYLMRKDKKKTPVKI